MSTDYSLILISPIEHIDTFVDLAYLIDGKEYAFTVELSSDGSAPATHKALHDWTSESSANAWTSDTTVPNLTSEQVAFIRANIIATAQYHAASPLEHFASTAATNGLQRVIVEEEM